MVFAWHLQQLNSPLHVDASQGHRDNFNTPTPCFSRTRNCPQGKWLRVCSLPDKTELVDKLLVNYFTLDQSSSWAIQPSHAGFSHCDAPVASL